jgi:hypothetical protein
MSETTLCCACAQLTTSQLLIPIHFRQHPQTGPRDDSVAQNSKFQIQNIPISICGSDCAFLIDPRVVHLRRTAADASE